MSQRPELVAKIAEDVSGLTPVAVTAVLEGSKGLRLSQRVMGDAVAVVDFIGVLLTAQIVLWLGAYNGVITSAEGTDILKIAPLLALAAVLAFRAAGLYEINKVVQVSHQAPRLLIVWTILSIAVAAAGSQLYKGPQFLNVAWLALTPAVLIGARGPIAVFYRVLVERGPLARRVALIGTSPFLGQGAAAINEDWLCRLAAVFDVGEGGRGRAIGEILARAKAGDYDDVVLLVPSFAGPEFDRLVQSLTALPVRVSVLPSAQIPEIAGGGAGSSRAASVVLSEKPVRGWAIVFKSLIDYAAATVILATMLVPMIAIALAIKLESRGPVIFRQHRTGRSGKIFMLYKFRSMYVCEDGPRIRQATENDPRVTRIGKWLRKLSLDELPQLINVLKGEMSLIGPRPHAVAHDHHYGALVPRYWDRFRVKPGITGWAQVNGHRGETKTLDDMAERVQFDIDYATDYSIWRDLWIMVLTPYTLIARRERAY